MSQSLKLRSFENAYPGSMFERSDGDYVRRDDPTSLAGALLEQIGQRGHEIDDLRDAARAQDAEVVCLAMQRDRLLASLQAMLGAMDDGSDEETLVTARAVVAEVTGSAS